MNHPASHEPFRSMLEARRASLVRAIASAINAAIERYRDVPEPAWLSAVDGVVGVFLSALDDLRPEEIRRWTRARMERSDDDFSLEAIVSAVAITRDELIDIALEGAQRGEPGARGAVRLLTKVHDVIAAELVEHAIRRSEATIRENERAEKALRESEERFRLLVELAPLGFAVHRQGVILYANPAAARLLGAASSKDLIGAKILSFVHPDSLPLVLERVRRMAQFGENMPIVEEKFQRLDGTTIVVETAAAPIMFEGAPAIQVAVVDISERKKVEETLRKAALQEEVIRSQEATLRELATPLIPVSEGVLVVPLVGAVDAGRAQQLLEALLMGVAAHRTRAAIIDVTGVPDLAVDVAEGLLRAARAVRLLGANAVLTGLSPAIARSLANAGVDLGGLTTRATLRDGIAHALAPSRNFW